MGRVFPGVSLCSVAVIAGMLGGCDLVRVEPEVTPMVAAPQPQEQRRRPIANPPVAKRATAPSQMAPALAGQNFGTMPTYPQQGQMPMMPQGGAVPMIPSQGYPSAGQVPMMPQGGGVPMMPPQGYPSAGQMPTMSQGFPSQGEMPMNGDGFAPYGQADSQQHYAPLDERGGNYSIPNYGAPSVGGQDLYGGIKGGAMAVPQTNEGKAFVDDTFKEIERTDFRSKIKSLNPFSFNKYKEVVVMTPLSYRYRVSEKASVSSGGIELADNTAYPKLERTPERPERFDKRPTMEAIMEHLHQKGKDVNAFRQKVYEDAMAAEGAADHVSVDAILKEERRIAEQVKQRLIQERHIKEMELSEERLQPKELLDDAVKNTTPIMESEVVEQVEDLVPDLEEALPLDVTTPEIDELLVEEEVPVVTEVPVTPAFPIESVEIEPEVPAEVPTATPQDKTVPDVEL